MLLLRVFPRVVYCRVHASVTTPCVSTQVLLLRVFPRKCHYSVCFHVSCTVVYTQVLLLRVFPRVVYCRVHASVTTPCVSTCRVLSCTRKCYYSVCFHVSCTVVYTQVLPLRVFPRVVCCVGKWALGVLTEKFTMLFLCLPSLDSTILSTWSSKLPFF